MANILDDIIYAAIMATLETLKDECHEHDTCENCPFLIDRSCAFIKAPVRYDLDKIKIALQVNGNNNNFNNDYDDQLDW